ncbi:hypothetical protein ACJ7VE_00085 [Streptomyces sp. PB17]|uniref:hypothetical protein n=1 Tax=Streptomyces sp. PB17 TaxID=3384158 RepID=UPI0038B609CB
MTTSELEPTEVVDAELVDDDEVMPSVPLPAAPAKPAVDQHTILYPGEALPSVATTPRYTLRDFEVSPETARRLEEDSAPDNTDRNYKNQRKLFEEWCDGMGRVTRPCTTGDVRGVLRAPDRPGQEPEHDQHVSAGRADVDARRQEAGHEQVPRPSA